MSAAASRAQELPPGLARMREIDYEALRFLMLRTDGRPFAKQRAVSKFDKAWRLGELHIPASETQDQKWWRCEARFLLGDYSDWGGWQYRAPFAANCWFVNPFLKASNAHPDEPDCPVWTGDRVGKLGIVSEQGIGDEVFFASVLPDVIERVDSVSLETDARLCSVFERSFGIECVPAKMRRKVEPDGTEGEGFERVMQNPALRGCDAWVTLADLGRIFRHKTADFHRRAYLRPDPAQVERFRSLAGRVGISWRGAQGEVDWKRMVRQYPNAVSLQYDQAWDEDVERPDCDLKDDLEGVLGVLANLERVVCVSTTVAHLAAASGVPTEVRLARFGSGRRSHLIPWKWVNRKHAPQTLWYPPSVTVREWPQSWPN